MFFSKSIMRGTSRGDRKLYANVIEIVGPLGEYARKNPARKNLDFECHSVCRAIAMVMPLLKVVDGQYLGAESKACEGGFFKAKLFTCEHSWLITPSGSIIDPYPVAIFSAVPILILNRGEYRHYGGGHYVENFSITRKISDRKMYRKSFVLARMLKEIKETIQDPFPEITLENLEAPFEP